MAPCPEDAVHQPADKGRPKSAVYLPKRCRETYPGHGGSPQPTQPPLSASRPLSAPATRLVKSEKWREAGALRWPPVAHGAAEEARRGVVGGTNGEQEPFHRHLTNPQPCWKGELWMRSLRKPGVLLQDPMYAQTGGGVKELHEEWRSCAPMTPRLVPYSGATASGRAAVPRQHDPNDWFLRPVATGKMSLDHMNGKRYQFSGQPRILSEQVKPPVGPAGLSTYPDQGGGGRSPRRSGSRTAR